MYHGYPRKFKIYFNSSLKAIHSLITITSWGINNAVGSAFGCLLLISGSVLQVIDSVDEMFLLIILVPTTTKIPLNDKATNLCRNYSLGGGNLLFYVIVKENIWTYRETNWFVTFLWNCEYGQ